MRKSNGSPIKRQRRTAKTKNANKAFAFKCAMRVLDEHKKYPRLDPALFAGMVIHEILTTIDEERLYIYKKK